MLNQDKDRKVAVTLALLGLVIPGLHKFYLGQYRWGVLYLVIGFTPIAAIAKVASLTDAVLYLTRGQLLGPAIPTAKPNDSPESSKQGWLSGLFTSPPASEPVNPQQVGAIADAIRHLEQLRQDGLMTEYEFEQKRRQLLEQMSK